MRLNRVLLKISGEALGRSEGVSLDPSMARSLAEQVKEVQELGVEIGIVVGGGNILRGALFSEAGTKRPTADQMGMLATVINALALSDALERMGVDTRVCSAVDVNPVAEPFIRRRAIRHMEKGRVVLLAGGTGNPYFTTDTAAALRAMEIGADALLKATKVDGIYDKDPMRHDDAERFDALTFEEALGRGLKVMDATAMTLCRENKLPIVVFDLFQPGNMARVVRGEKLGTWLRN
ncbi:MAG: UMP kinase [Planctomycetota bacterium]|nr:MAG: UMP kinase [Planctomycetota bacterium]